MFYDFTNPKVDYLNFKVKLTIGIRSDNKHIQYCVNKIEVKKRKADRTKRHKLMVTYGIDFQTAKLHQTFDSRKGFRCFY